MYHNVSSSFEGGPNLAGGTICSVVFGPTIHSAIHCLGGPNVVAAVDLGGPYVV